MKPRNLLAGVMTVAALAGLVVVLVQQRGLATLREQQVSLAKAATVGTPAVAADSAPAAGGAALTDAERVELMQLRSKVTDLRERQRRIGAISNEHVQLQARLASATNVNAGRYPAGWVKRQDARRAGFATPQAAFESMIWAFANRDTNVLFQAIAEEELGGLQQMLASGKAEEFWREVGKFPGFLVRSAENAPDGTVRLRVELVPGVEGPGVTARRAGDGWRVDMN